jgi:hypothetical protein
VSLDGKGKIWPEENAIVQRAIQGQGDGGYVTIAYDRGKGETTYVPVLHRVWDKATNQSRYETLDEALGQISANTGLLPDEIIEQVSQIPRANATDEQWQAARQLTEAGMRRNQELAGMHTEAMGHGAARAAKVMGADLMGEDEKRRALAARAMGLDEAALASRFGAAPLPNATADIGMPDWIPRMDNLSPVQTGMAYGALAAGTGAAGLALVNHLIAQGQQQANPVEYAAAMQALNAYA